MISNRHLRYFLAVVDEGGVHAAAEKLFVSQPSVSQAIQTLQNELGVELFERVGRRLRLTAAGEALISPARQVIHWLRLSRAHVEAVAGLQTGELTIATMPSQAVDPIAETIYTFTDTHPMVRISIRAAGTPEEIFHDVRTGTVELGVAAVIRMPPAEGLKIHPLARQGFIVISTKEAGLPSRASVMYQDLEGHRLIAGQPGTGMRLVADEAVARNNLTRIVVETQHREAILPMVLNQTGIAIMAAPWRSLALKAGLVVHDMDTEAHLEVMLVRRDTGLSPAALAFLHAADPARSPLEE